MPNNYLPEGFIINQRENTEYTASLTGLEYAAKNNITLESRAVLCDSEHNLILELCGYRAIIPKSEAIFSPDGSVQKDIAIITKVGKPVAFKIALLPKNPAEEPIILSRKQAQKECYENFISHLRQGDIIDARVTHTEPFGAFCDIGNGIVSLLSVDCISVSRINHPSERFRAGQKIKCAIKTNDTQTGRITLTTKELLGTWEQNASLFNAGETAAGIIRSIEPYGIFVELTPNLAGLAEWCPDVYPGQSAAVYIKSIIPEKMKIKLVIIDASDQGLQNKPLEYRFTEGHISRWDYSPESCPKKIFTDFDSAWQE